MGSSERCAEDRSSTSLPLGADRAWREFVALLASDSVRVVERFPIDPHSVQSQTRWVHRSKTEGRPRPWGLTQILSGASLAFCSEEFVMKRLSTGSLSSIEKAVIDEIRALRASPGSVQPSTLLASPARFVHHFIHASHGNVQLRIATLARELGVEMRTLERTFFDEYQKTMVQCQVEVRLAFSLWLLAVFPPTKISAIAALLGYDQVQGFNRFFKRHMRQSPSAWGHEER
jgi:AraC-like DNA-binding protein